MGNQIIIIGQLTEVKNSRDYVLAYIIPLKREPDGTLKFDMICSLGQPTIYVPLYRGLLPANAG